MKTLICCFAILSVIVVGAPVQAQHWELYDHFKGGFFNQGFIDPDKWNGFVYPTAFPPALFRGENDMELKFGSLRIHNHDYTGSSMAGVTPISTNPLILPPSISSEENLYLNFDDPGVIGVKGLKATLNVLRAEAFSPQACLPQTFPYTTARARLFGAFFQNTGSSGGGRDVMAVIFVERAANSSDPFYTLNVKGLVVTCLHSNYCTTWTPVSPLHQIGTVHLWENFDLSVYWDQPQHHFIYRLNDTEFTVDLTALNLRYDNLPLYPRKAISAVNIFTTCPDQEASMDVYFDNVQVSRE
jgi:hypothetical protein